MERPFYDDLDYEDERGTGYMTDDDPMWDGYDDEPPYDDLDYEDERGTGYMTDDDPMWDGYDD